MKLLWNVCRSWGMTASKRWRLNRSKDTGLDLPKSERGVPSLDSLPWHRARGMMNLLSD